MRSNKCHLNQVRVKPLLLAVSLFLLPALLHAMPIEQQRVIFQQAHQALQKNHLQDFFLLKARIPKYPLTPYLDIWHARKRLAKGDDTQIPTLLQRYAEIPETINLRVAWIKYLAKQQQWQRIQQLFIQYPRMTRKFKKIAMLTHWHMGQKQQAFHMFSKQWLQGKATTPLTQDIYQAWLQTEHPNHKERWQRINALVSKGRWSLVHHESHDLNPKQRQWLSYWQQLQHRPKNLLTSWPKQLNSSQASLPAAYILRDIITRLARKDISQAWESLQKLQVQQPQIDPNIITTLQRQMALRAARAHKYFALDWLIALPASSQDKDTRGWKMRLAMLSHQWEKLLSTIKTMPKAEKTQDRWLYWQAKALLASGKTQQATQIFSALAKGRGYYNFLSAEQLKLPYHLENIAIQANTKYVEMMLSRPAILRAHEWLKLNKRNKASREWHYALAGSSTEEWKAATSIAATWQWSDQVIRAAFKAGEIDALFDRFPVSYEMIVMNVSKQTGLPAAVIWSIIRQESAFNQHAVSYVGAKGLMQLMPATARQVSKKLKGKRRPELFSAQTNIKLGSTYLASMARRFDNLALAAAAYNAGPHRVSKWLKRTPFASPEAWIEAIPFKETRRYVQQVMAFISVYEWRQHKKISSIIKRVHANEKIL